MTERQVATIVAPWMNAAIEKHGQGEKILWECSLLPVQDDPSAPPQPGLIVLVWFPGAILGDSINGSFRIHNPMTVTEEEIDHVMASFLEHLRQARSQQLASMQSDAKADALAGT